MAALTALAGAIGHKFAGTIGPTILLDLQDFVKTYQLRSLGEEKSKNQPQERDLDTSKYASKHAPNAQIQAIQALAQPRRGQETPRDKGNGPTYAEIARKPIPIPTPKQQTRRQQQQQQQALPKSLKGMKTQTKPIKITIQLKDKETPTLIKGIKSYEEAQAIVAVKKINNYQALVYPGGEEQSLKLQNSGEWLRDIGGAPYKRQFFIVIHDIEQQDLKELALKIQQQNQLEATPTVSMMGDHSAKIGLYSPEEANRLISQGLVLDYEIKRAYKARSRSRCKGCKEYGHKVFHYPERKQTKVKEYFREKVGKVYTAATTPFSAPTYSIPSQNRIPSPIEGNIEVMDTQEEGYNFTTQESRNQATQETSKQHETQDPQDPQESQESQKTPDMTLKRRGRPRKDPLKGTRGLNKVTKPQVSGIIQNCITAYTQQQRQQNE
jgi:hypothetical protein